jgi:hypothetical protein
MFRIECFCDDRKLAAVLLAMQGLLLDIPKVQPVANAAVKNGELVAETNGTAVAMFVAYLRKKKIGEVNAAITKDFLSGQGRSPNSYSSLLRGCINQGFLKKAGGKTGKGHKTQYVVTAPKGKE